MKKKIKVLGIILVVLIGMFSLTACKKKETVTTERFVDGLLVGTWEYEDETSKTIYTFDEDGNGTYKNIVAENTDKREFEYDAYEGKISIRFKKPEEAEEVGYTIEEDVLTIKEASDTEKTFKKK